MVKIQIAQTPKNTAITQTIGDEASFTKREKEQNLAKMRAFYITTFSRFLGNNGLSKNKKEKNMKIQPPDGFVNIEVIDEFKRSAKSNLLTPTWQAFQKALIGKVLGVGNPGIGYDNKYYDTSGIKENDYVIFVPFDSVIYQYIDETTGKVVEIYKTPVSSVLAVLENYEE